MDGKQKPRASSLLANLLVGPITVTDGTRIGRERKRERKKERVSGIDEKKGRDGGRIGMIERTSLE